MFEEMPDVTGITPKEWQKRKKKVVNKLRKERRKQGKIPSLALKQAAVLLGKSKAQVRRYVDDGDPNPPTRQPRFDFTDWFIMLANGYGGRIKQLHRDLLAGSVLVPPVYVTFWRAWNRLPRERREFPKKGIEAHRRLRLYVGWEAPHRNAAWQVDICRLDYWILPKGSTEPVRPWMIAVIDDYSRMIMAWMITTKAPTGADVRCVLAAAMLRRNRGGHWYGGRPSAVRWDNGNELINKLVTLFAMRVKFDAYAVAPYTPTAKGKIERFFRTIQRWALIDVPGYIKGPKTMDKTEVFFGPADSLWSDEQLIARIRERIDYYNFERPHRMLNYRTPYERWCDDPTPLTEVTRKKVRDCFLPMVESTRTFSKMGVQLQYEHYTCLELPGGRHESDLIDQEVYLRGLPHETSWFEVYDKQGQWLCTVQRDFTMDEIARHGMRRDAERREMERALKEGAAKRLEAASELDPVTGTMPSIVEVAQRGVPAPEVSAEPKPGLGQLFDLRHPTVRDAVEGHRKQAGRRRGPRRTPRPPDEMLPLEA